jgi:hypothetical protein
MAAPRALASLEVPPAVENLGLRQVFDTGNALRRIRRILSRSSHLDVLPEDSYSSRELIGPDRGKS